MSASNLAGRLAVLHDMTAEAWPSMDQMGRLITERVPVLAPGLSVTPVTHPLVPLVSWGSLRRVGALFFADRVMNRMWLYPRRVMQTVRGRFDLYHLVDHSYAQLALALPAESTVITCHDVDTFRSLVEPVEHPRSRAFNAMTRRILRGLRRARTIVCVSAAARDDLVRFGLAEPSRLRVIPNGIDPELLRPATPKACREVAALVPRRPGTVDILHVGSDIPRKRLDRAIEVASALRTRERNVRLIRVGSPMRAATKQQAIEHTLEVVELPFLDRDRLRAVYERADLLLLPSDREGFGLPVLEAFAAGKPVVASGIPALRESSGGLAACVRPDAIREWIAAVEHILAARHEDAPLAEARRRRASSLTWDTHVSALLDVYGDVIAAARHPSTTAGATAASARPRRGAEGDRRRAPQGAVTSIP